MPRIARAIGINRPHHITQRGNNRSQVFFDAEDLNFYLKILGKYSLRYRLDIWAYCLMETHAHILAVPRLPESLAKGFGVTNLVYTRYLNAKFDNSGRVWQNRFFSCIVDTDGYLWAVARYIENNPVKAGMVLAAGDYPWSSARAHLSGRHDQLLSEESWLASEDRDGYGEFVGKEDARLEERIRKLTSTGRPLGDEAFVQNMERELGRTLTLGHKGRPSKN